METNARGFWECREEEREVCGVSTTNMMAPVAVAETAMLWTGDEKLMGGEKWREE